jgi:hypothetical protein
MTDRSLFQSFNPVSLDALDSLSLMDRIDTKFIFNARLLPALLERIAPHYYVLEINGQRFMPYRSVYFDTPDYSLYLHHHNGRLERYKVRMRDYLISDRSFFEVKRKTVKKKTKKKRIEVPFQCDEIKQDGLEFLRYHSPLGDLKLVPSLENSFQRITLAGFASNERVTLDVEVCYQRKGQKFSLDGLVIAEIKRGKACSHSPVQQALRELHVHTPGFSKYCIGIACMVDGVKYNNFKPKLLTINRILQ